MHLNIFVSQKCFLHCKGCYSFSRTEDYSKIISTDILVSFLNYAYQRGVYKVTLCGGDPLTRCDILKLLKRIKKIGYIISLDTVGTALLRPIKSNEKIVINKISIKKIAQLVDTIGIPIDGSTNEIIKLFRQSKSNILLEQLKICDELHKYNANICINTVVHKGNLKDVFNLTNLIMKLDYINTWQIFQYAPLGKYGILNREKFEITDNEFKMFKINVLKNFNNKSKIQFKGFKERNKIYMLIDNSGNAWIPNYDNKILTNKNLTLEKRNLIGNINNKNDWEKICEFLKKKDINNET